MSEEQADRAAKLAEIAANLVRMGGCDGSFDRAMAAVEAAIDDRPVAFSLVGGGISARLVDSRGQVARYLDRRRGGKRTR